MAPPRVKNPKRTAQYYRNNPEARAKKDAYNTAFNTKPEQRRKRVELKQARRDRGIDGRGGGDLSHTRSGRLVRESVSANRGRNRGRK